MDEQNLSQMEFPGMSGEQLPPVAKHKPGPDDFAGDESPVELVDGVDAFMEKGRYLLFVEMIGVAAKDLCLPPEHADHQDAQRWLEDIDNVAAFCALLDGEVNLASTISKAVLANPKEVSAACESLIRGAGRSDATSSFRRLKAALGAREVYGQSSIAAFEDEESLEDERVTH